MKKNANILTNKKAGLWSFMASLILAFSCVHDFDPKEPKTLKTDYIVNGILFKDSLPQIYLQRSHWFDAIDPQKPVNDAEVWIHSKPLGSENEELNSELLSFKEFYYTGQTSLEAGTEYFLEVKTRDGFLLTAHTMIPHPDKITKTKLVFPAGIMETATISGSFIRFHMDFTRSIGNSFYETFIFCKETFNPQNSQMPFQILQTLNQNEIILKEALPDTYNYSFVFSANNASNDLISLQFDNICCCNPFFDEFNMVLQTCSEEYYHYKKSLFSHLDALKLKEYVSTDDLYFPDIFKSVNPVYSNIQGGKGIFAGVSMHVSIAPCNLVGNTCE